jgi:hypothetical protein
MPSPLTSLLLFGLAASAVAAVAVPIFHESGSAVPIPPATGHLILQVEGDVRALQVVRITVKQDPCGLARVASPFSIAILDAAERELDRVPLDLSQFDLDPAHLGQAPRVEGCVIKDSRIAALVNVPHYPTAARLVILRGSDVLGGADAARYSALLAQGVR